jgi:hypothetical protein
MPALVATALLGACGGGEAGARSGGASPGVQSSSSPAGVWRPSPGTAWQWQLSGTLDTSVEAAVYDVDVDTTTAAAVAALHARGRHVICYVNAGAYESFRTDHGDFPASVLGKDNGWPGERWLDVRRIDVLGPIMARRFDVCRQKGFDAVEPDNVDGYANESGFPLTAADQLAYDRYLASLAHDRGLSVGLKNDLDQVPDLAATFDFAVVEQCFENDECDGYSPFVRAGKAVLEAEYSGSPTDFCAQARQLGLSSLLKHESLDAWRQSC